VTTTAEPELRPLRRDAERNRQKILAAARDVFADRGLAATLDDVADRAGVGVGTVYRRFASREVLVDEIFAEELDGLAALAAECRYDPDGWAGFARFLGEATERLALNRGLCQITLTSTHGRSRVEACRERIAPAVELLVQRAQAEGQLRADLAVTDVPVLMEMLAGAADFGRGAEPELWRRYLTVVLDGLRAQRTDTSELPIGALSDDQLDQAMASPCRWT
jgi:AcrR family transcriptional regulator